MNISGNLLSDLYIWRQPDSVKIWYLHTNLHGNIFQKTGICSINSTDLHNLFITVLQELKCFKYMLHETVLEDQHLFEVLF